MDKTILLSDRIRIQITKQLSVLLGDDYPLARGPLQDIYKAVHNPVNVAVMGEFSAGKSTFINKLLSINALPVSIMPKTATVTRIVYGQTPKVEITYDIGGEVVEQVKEGYDCLRELQQAKKVDDPLFFKEIDSIREVRVYVDHPLLKRFTIIDTPGFNHNDKMDEKTMAVIGETNVVIWLSDFSQLAKQTEFERIKTIRESVDAIYLVVNKVDVHVETSEQYETACHETIQSLKENGFFELFDGTDIHLISCKTSIPFWDGKFEQFRSAFAREVLDNDLELSIKIIDSAYSRLKDALDRERMQYIRLKDQINILKKLMDTNRLFQELKEDIHGWIEPDIRKVLTAIDDYKRRCGKLATTKLTAVNEYIREFLYHDVEVYMEKMRENYGRFIYEKRWPHLQERMEKIDTLIKEMPESEKKSKATLNTIKAYIEMQLDYQVSSGRQFLPATCGYLAYLNTVSSEIFNNGFAFIKKSIFGGSDEDERYSDILSQLDEDLMSDICIYFSHNELMSILNSASRIVEERMDVLSTAIDKIKRRYSSE